MTRITESKLHPRNVHNRGYDFTSLIAAHPKLKSCVFRNEYNTDTIDFSSLSSVVALNTALLKHHYTVQKWSIPENNLCPGVPGRADYIHYLADLLKETNNNKPVFSNSGKSKVHVLDIGTGAGCIYPILGHKIYQWAFTATDIDSASLESCRNILSYNLDLKDNVRLKRQSNSSNIFFGVINDEKIDLTMCNPPFHNSLEEGRAGSKNKWQGLSKDPEKEHGNTAPKLNFAGQKAELWCNGGELQFIKNMINESKHFKAQVLWFTTLVSKRDNMSKLKLALKKSNVQQVKVIKMTQGNKISRILAWTFLTPDQIAHWCAERF